MSLETKDNSTIEMNREEILLLDYQYNTNTQMKSSYNKSYCRSCNTVSIFDYTWQLEHFNALHKSVTAICSTAFPKAAWYRIEMRLFHPPSECEDTVVKFYMLTEKPFCGVCDISVIHLDEKISCTSIAGYTANNSILYETTAQALFRYINEDVLTLNFTITVFKILTNTIHITSIPLHPTSMKKHENLTSEEVSLCSPYVIFQTNEEMYKISKASLYNTKSYYFSLICKSHGKEDTDVIVTLDKMSDAFVMMLTFIETGSLPKSVSSDELIISKLLMLSYKYDVNDLKVTCEKYLIQNITIKNAIIYLDMAMKYEADILQDHVMGFLKFNFKEIIKTEKFRQLPQSLLDEIIKSFQQLEMKKHISISIIDDLSHTQ